jgi:CheY-like chemotaxis protein
MAARSSASGRRLLVIEDNPAHLRVWQERIEEEGWECVPILANTVEDALVEIEGYWASDPYGFFDATILDVMFGRQGLYDGLDAFKDAEANYKGRFGTLVVASAIEWSDERVAQFMKEYGALRCGSPLSRNVTDMVSILRRRFKDPPKSS